MKIPCMKGFLFLGFLIVASCHLTEGRRFHNHSVVRVFPRDLASLDAIRKFRLSHSELDFWREPSKVDSPVDFMVGPEDQSDILRELRRDGFHPQVIIPDVQRILILKNQNQTQTDYLYDVHELLGCTYEWFDSLPSTYPDVVSLETIGSSWEGRDLKLLRFNKDCGIPKTAAFIVANSLTTEELQEPHSIRRYADLWPPDWNRMWVRTMSDHDPEDGCIGVDPERNFDFHWSVYPVRTQTPFVPRSYEISWTHELTNHADVSSHSRPVAASGDCSSAPSPFSESETRAIADYVLENMPQLDFKLYLDIHSYSQFFLFPWGFTTTHPDDYDDLVSLSLSPFHCVEQHIDESSGTSTDWMKGVAGIKYSYECMLRDTGVWGFLLPPFQIIPSGEETLDGLVALLDAVRERSCGNVP
ncbi:unnamed protein product [Darwinula stevensoni]|uniref:Peptidase M14 domain-containing protein n=1 Tax=Darwinula stevensoni TaxID=69355 RepID=A0A7R8XIL5_9CRUS|nr:unnamed protein product [Darwinula stevensoni]CAG0893554.1 unnamed protein product [Darwinula stevensoni]